jgi:hypothetical protein
MGNDPHLASILGGLLAIVPWVTDVGEQRLQCAVKRRWSTAGERLARELDRSTR